MLDWRVVSARDFTRLARSAEALSTTAPQLQPPAGATRLRATWTGEWAFTVALGVVAFRDGGATAVGVVGFIRMAPATFLSPVGGAIASPRDRVFGLVMPVACARNGGGGCGPSVSGPAVAVYALAAIATAAFTTFRPAHSALLPALSVTPLELTSANVVRGLMDSLSTLVGALAAALLLTLSGPTAVLAMTAALALGSAAFCSGCCMKQRPGRTRCH